MPPCLGQGMCSGMRDAANLAWKLDLVVKAKVDDVILDSYTSERLPHVRAWSNLALRAGHIAFTTDIHLAAERDARFRNGEVPDFGAPPKLGQGLFDPETGGDWAHEMFPQRIVERQGQTMRFDDVVGDGFVLVGLAKDKAALRNSDLTGLAHLPISTVTIGEGGDMLDPACDYAGFFERLSAAAIIIRPDRYIFGAAPTVTDLPGLIDRLSTAIPAPNRTNTKIKESVHG